MRRRVNMIPFKRLEIGPKREEMVGISPVVCGDASVSAGLRGQCGGVWVRQRAILTFPTSLMRKRGVFYACLLLH